MKYRKPRSGLLSYPLVFYNHVVLFDSYGKILQFVLSVRPLGYKNSYQYVPAGHLVAQAS